MKNSWYDASNDSEYVQYERKSSSKVLADNFSDELHNVLSIWIVVSRLSYSVSEQI